MGFRSSALFAPLFVAAIAGSASAGAQIDDVNGNAPPGFFVFDVSINAIGWMYRPIFDYNLDGFSTTFADVPNFDTLGRNVTMSVWDKRPVDGGTRLGTGDVFVDRTGGVQTVNFPGIDLTANTDYFISIENVGRLGIDIVQPINNDFAQGQPQGTVFLDGWYGGFNGDTSFKDHVPLFDANNFPNPFAAPILRFNGTRVPTPGAGALLVIGSLAGARRRR